ncbi:MAG: hypothetical protein KC502_20085 [Myxococcales bacterium]|nr:hypothetical protein [Myxococcales bacterium]
MFRDVLTSMDLSMAPVIALVAFFLGFVGIAAWLVLSNNGSHFDRMNELPLHDGALATGQSAVASTVEGDHE